jgi:hypothetical protein
MLMNFGPINQNGGERRLNVAFSRAKKQMALVSSIRHHSITNDYNDGARALKNYIRYAEACSIGDAQTVRRILWEINPAESTTKSTPPANVVIIQLSKRLADRGYEVETNVGQSGFRCDLAVRAPGERRYRLGIMVDTDSYYQNTNVLERDLLRPRLLRSFGWDTVQVLTKNWFEDSNAVLAAIEQKLSIVRADQRNLT